MRTSVAAVLVVLLGAFAAHFLLADRGYVLVNFRGYVIEMSVPGLVIVLVLAYLLVRALIAVVQAPKRWRASRERRQAARRDTDLADGLRQLIEGNWARSERMLTKGLKHADAPLANYLLAAHAAQLQGASDRRDQWLELAQGTGEEAATSAQLTRAQLQLQAGEPAAAVETLKVLEQQNAAQPAVVAMLARAYRALDDRAQLLALLPRLARASLPPVERVHLEQLAVEGELSRSDLTAERLAEVWNALPGEVRDAAAVIAERARALARLGDSEQAERELRGALKREWHQALVEAYGDVRGPDPAKQLKHVEGWLDTHPDDTALLNTAARLSLANELWGKARSYLESSLALSPEPETYRLYGRLLTALGEDDGALSAFRTGLDLVSPAAAEPLPPSRRLAPPTRDTPRTAKS